MGRRIPKQDPNKSPKRSFRTGPTHGKQREVHDSREDRTKNATRGGRSGGILVRVGFSGAVSDIAPVTVDYSTREGRAIFPDRKAADLRKSAIMKKNPSNRYAMSLKKIPKPAQDTEIWKIGGDLALVEGGSAIIHPEVLSECVEGHRIVIPPMEERENVARYRMRAAQL